MCISNLVKTSERYNLWNLHKFDLLARSFVKRKRRKEDKKIFLELLVNHQLIIIMTNRFVGSPVLLKSDQSATGLNKDFEAWCQ